MTGPLAPTLAPTLAPMLAQTDAATLASRTDGLGRAEVVEIALLYEAAFGRAADEAGLNFWIDQAEAGLFLPEIAAFFVASPEFAATNGAPDTLSDEALVAALYENVLGRPGEDEGIAFWTGVAGQPDVGTAELLLAFATAEENRAQAERLDDLAEIAPGTWGFGPGAPAATTAADFDGSGQVIVVIDDGYSELYDQSATVFEFDFSGAGDPDASVDDPLSHGAWVAQTALAEASGADIIHFKVFPDGGESATLSDIEEALRGVVTLAESGDDLDIAAVNLSLGFGNTTGPILSPLSDEFAALDALGIIPVVATGNAGQTYDDGVSILAADPGVVSVAAVDDAGRLAAFSQSSDALVDVAATGVDVRVDTLDGRFAEVSGTSFAAPEISGIAARLSQASEELLGEDLTDEEFLDVLERSGTAVAGEPFVEADGDAAVAFFIENVALYDDPLVA